MTAQPAEETVVELRVPARSDRLKLIRSCIGEGAEIAGLSHDAVQDLVHAADEVCQNIIRHGYGGRGDGEIDVAMARTADRVTLVFTDHAPPMPESALVPRTTSYPERGGMGTQVIHACVDDVALTRGPDGQGNQLTLTKWIPTP